MFATEGIRRSHTLCAVVCLAIIGAAWGDDVSADPTTTSSGGESSSGQGSIPSDISATLRIAAWPDWGHLQRAAEQFREVYPNVEFEFQGVEQSYFERLPQTLATDDAPDVTAIQASRGGPWSEIIEAGLVVDLTSVWEEQGLFEAYDPNAVDEFKDAEGVPMSTPLHVVWAPVVYYNKAIFEEIGLDAPAGPVATTDEWDAMVSALEEAGHVPLVGGLSDDNAGSFVVGSFLQTACGTDAYLNLVTNFDPAVEDTTTWESDCAISALSAYKDWTDSGVFGVAPETLSASQALSLFASGTAGMIVDGSWSGLTPTWEADLDVGAFLVPPVPDAVESTTKYQVALGDGLAVPTNSDNVELAKAFVSYVLSADFQGSAAYLDAPGPSPREDVASPEGTPELFAEQAAARSSVGSVPMMLTVPYAGEVYLILANLVADQATVEETAAELARLSQEAEAAA